MGFFEVIGAIIEIVLGIIVFAFLALVMCVHKGPMKK